MRKGYLLTIAVIVCLVLGGVAYSVVGDDIDLHKSCSLCGMDRKAFDFSRMLIEYSDGTVGALCSLHCASIHLANNIDKTPKAIKVADFNGKHLIDAKTAVWVVGGDKPGVMSKQGKWAFEKKSDAEAFMKINQGMLVSYEEAVNAAYNDMYADTNMIRQKRMMKRMQMNDQKTAESHSH